MLPPLLSNDALLARAKRSRSHCGPVLGRFPSARVTEMFAHLRSRNDEVLMSQRPFYESSARDTLNRARILLQLSLFRISQLLLP